MKTLTLFFASLIALPLSLLGQMRQDPDTNEIKYTEVMELPNFAKEEIYNKAKLWVVSSLKSGDNMVELSGNNSDQIIGTGNIGLDSITLTQRGSLFSKDASLNFKFIVFIKDGRLKYSVENFSLTYKDVIPIGYVETGLDPIRRPYNVVAKRSEEYQERTQAYLDRKIRILIKDFKVSMQKTVDEDW